MRCNFVNTYLVSLHRKEKATQTAGAIHHIYERLGRAADTSVDREISAAMQSHGLRSEDDYAGLIARASVLYVPNDGDIDLAATALRRF